jgi:hypothetical protein
MRNNVQCCLEFRSYVLVLVVFRGKRLEPTPGEAEPTVTSSVPTISPAGRRLPRTWDAAKAAWIDLYRVFRNLPRVWPVALAINFGFSVPARRIGISTSFPTPGALIHINHVAPRSSVGRYRINVFAALHMSAYGTKRI